MTSFARARFKVLVVMALCGAIVVTTKPIWRGSFNADIAVGGSENSALRLGVRGGVGSERPQNATSAAPARVDVLGTGVPYNGPTSEEKAAIDNVRAAMHEHWQYLKKAMGGQFPSEYPEPYFPEPMRHLTPYEINQLNQMAKDFRRDIASRL